jgi:hypothetical protein
VTATSSPLLLEPYLLFWQPPGEQSPRSSFSLLFYIKTATMFLLSVCIVAHEFTGVPLLRSRFCRPWYVPAR